MNRYLISALSFIFLVTSFVSPVQAGYEDTLPNASCVGGKLVIYMNPRGDNTKHAVRIDDLANPWNPHVTNPGDTIVNDTRNSAFTIQKEVSHEYSWWIHKIDAQGNYSQAQIGRTYCLVDSPAGLTATYEYPYVTLRWNSVPGAVRYAVRADNQINAWNGDNPNDGDHVVNRLTSTEFRFKAARDRKISWWVHAVDKYGAYSSAAVGKVLETQ